MEESCRDRLYPGGPLFDARSAEENNTLFCHGAPDRVKAYKRITRVLHHQQRAPRKRIPDLGF